MASFCVRERMHRQYASSIENMDTGKPQVKTMLIEFEKANLVEGQREIVKYAKREGITSIIFLMLM